MLKIFVIVSLLMSTAFAQRIELETRVLGPSEIISLIGPFPKNGSVDEAQDFKVLMYFQNNRTAADCALAKRDESITVETMFGGDVGILNDDETARMTAFLIKAYAGAGINAYIAKSTFKRPRPYESNPAIKPCIDLESSYAYPSGHSLTVRLFARIISKIYPERAEKLLKRAHEYALNRVIGGVHHPSDVKAAFIMADHLAEEMIEREDFLKALDTL